LKVYIGFEYKITGCKLKETLYGTKIALYLTDKYDKDVGYFYLKVMWTNFLQRHHLGN